MTGKSSHLESLSSRLEDLRRIEPDQDYGVLPATDFAIENCLAFFDIIGVDPKATPVGIFPDIDHPGGVYVEWFPKTHALSISFLPEPDDELGDTEMFMVRL